MILPQPRGAANDQAARIIAEPIGRVLRQPVVVENRPGAVSALALVAPRRLPFLPDPVTQAAAGNTAPPLPGAPADLLARMRQDCEVWGRWIGARGLRHEQRAPALPHSGFGLRLDASNNGNAP